MTTAKETEIPNSSVSPPQSPPQKKHNNPRMPPEIPEKLIFDEILPRIPAKILVIFKLVSHQWNSFISYPTTHFGNTHLSLSSTQNSRSVLTTNHLHSFFEAIEYENNGGLNITKFGTDLDVLPIDKYLVASCNGLVFLICVHDQRLKCKCEVKYEHKCECRYSEFQLKLPDKLDEFEFHYLVCNPVLGIESFVEIDHPHDQICLGSSDSGYYNYTFGFGYVSFLDDYNIVVIKLPMSPRRPEVVVHLYSLRLLRWGTPRKFKQNRLPLEFQNEWYTEIGTLVKETLHWGVTVGKNQKCIAAFDLAAHQDEFKFMRLPYPDFGDTPRPPRHGCAFRLCCLDNCLCACGMYVDDDGVDVVEMWMLKEYGRHESWTKLFLFDRGLYFGFTKAGMGLIHFFGESKLWPADFSCDPPQDMGIAVEHISEAVDYVQSLVSPLAIISEQ